MTRPIWNYNDVEFGTSIENLGSENGFEDVKPVVLYQILAAVFLFLISVPFVV